MADDVQVLIGAQIAGFTAGVNEVKDQLEGLAAFTQGIQATFVELGEVMLAAFAVDQIKEFANSMGELGVQLDRSSRVLGLTAEQMAAFQAAARLTDVSADSIPRMFERLSTAIETAQKGTGTAATAFRDLGISVGQLAKDNPTTQLNTIADAFARMPDGARKSADGMALFSRNFYELLPFLDKGSQGLADLEQHAVDLGLNLSDSVIQGMVQTKDKLNDLSLASEGLKVSLFDVFKPGLDALIEQFTNLVAGLSKSIQEGGAFGDILKVLSLTLDDIVLIVDAVVAGFKALAATFVVVIKEITETVAGIGVIIHDAFTKGMDAARADCQRIGALMLSDYQKYGQEMAANANTFAEQYKKLAEAAAGQGQSKPAKPSGGGAPPSTWGETDKSRVAEWEADLDKMLMKNQEFFGDATRDELAYWQKKLQLTSLSTEEQSEIIKKVYGLEKQLRSDDVKDYVAYLNDQITAAKGNWSVQMALENQKLQYLKQVYGQESSEYRNALREQENMTNQHVQQVSQRLHSIFSSFNSDIEGMIRGTETFQQAVSNMFWNLAGAIAGVFEKMLAEWIAQLIVGKAAGESTAVENIAASAAQAGAAAYAATAAIPIIGPELAPAAGAAAYAGAIAYEGLASFDVGSWSVPGDMTANIHKGEMIIPRTFADSLRENGGGLGGGQTTININAVDSQSFANMVKSNPGAIMHVVKTQARNLNPAMAR